MAFSANAIWETWPTSGSDTNGGGFDPSLTANMPTDLNCTAGTGNSPVVTSASYNFASTDVGAWLFIALGTNWIPGWYQIASVASNAATLTASVGNAILYNATTVQNTTAGCSTTATNTNGATWAIDYSQQATAVLALTGESTAAAVITTTSGAVTVAMVGNACYLSGTGITTQRRFIIQYNTSLTFTVDASVGTGTAVVVNVGGALNTLNQAFGTTGGVGKNLFWLKNTGTLLISGSDSTTMPAGAIGALTQLVGYYQLRGDLDGAVTFTNHPLIQANNSNISLIKPTNYNSVRNIHADAGTGGTKGYAAVNSAANNTLFVNCEISGAFTAGGLGLNSYGMAVNCLVTGSVTAGGISGGSNNIIDSCSVISGTGVGFKLTGNNNFLTRCVSANNSGSTSDGYQLTGANNFVENCIAYNNGRDGIRGTATGTFDFAFVRNNIFASNTGYGINSTTTNYQNFNSGYNVYQDYNAFYNNTAPRNNFPTGLHDQILTGNPFNLATSTDFSLNSTAGAGASCRSNGFPGTLSGMTSTGYEDIGAIRHQDPSGGGVFSPFPGGQMLGL